MDSEVPWETEEHDIFVVSAAGCGRKSRRARDSQFVARREYDRLEHPGQQADLVVDTGMLCSLLG